MFANVSFCLPKFLGIVGGMNKERDWRRLADFALSARGSRSQKAIDKLGGPSHTTLGKIERAEWRPTRAVDDTIQKLESVYRWAEGVYNNWAFHAQKRRNAPAAVNGRRGDVSYCYSLSVRGLRLPRLTFHDHNDPGPVPSERAQGIEAQPQRVRAGGELVGDMGGNTEDDGPGEQWV